MAFRFTVGRKIGSGFGILIFLTFVAFGATLITLNDSRQINDRITNLYTPSVSALQELNIIVVRSKMLISNWINIQIESEDKDKLKKLIKDEYPDLKKRVNDLAKGWNKDDKESISSIFNILDGLIADHEYIMTQLNSFESYQDAGVLFEVKNMVEDTDGEVNERTRNALNKLSKLIEQQHAQSTQKNKEMLSSFSFLQNVVVGLGIILFIGGILIAFFTVRTIVRPVDEVKQLLIRMARGILPDKKIKAGHD